jgi:hypothetical protein
MLLLSFLFRSAPNLELLIAVISEEIPASIIQELKRALPLLDVITESVEQLIEAGKYDLVRKYCSMGLIKAQVSQGGANVAVTLSADGLSDEELQQRVDELIEHEVSNDDWFYEYVRIKMQLFHFGSELSFF